MFTHATGALGGPYAMSANNDLIISVQIEHPDAIKEIDNIVKEDIDVAFVRSSTLESFTCLTLV